MSKSQREKGARRKRQLIALGLDIEVERVPLSGATRASVESDVVSQKGPLRHFACK